MLTSDILTVEYSRRHISKGCLDGEPHMITRNSNFHEWQIVALFKTVSINFIENKTKQTAHSATMKALPWKE